MSAHTLPPFTARELQAMEFPPLEFVCDPILVSGATLLGGRPKTGKTWLAQEIALSVAGGHLAACEWATTEGDALYLALEDNARRLQSRLAKLRPGGTWPDRLTFQTESPRMGDGFEDMVAAWARSCTKPRLVVVDTYNFVRPLTGSDKASYERDYGHSGSIARLANELDLSILVIHHLRKMDAEDPLDAISGTTGIAAGFDSILTLARSPEGSLVLQGRGRDILPVEIAMKFDADTAAWSVEGDPAVARVSDERRSILHYLGREGEAAPKEVADATGLSHEVTRKLLGKMVLAGLIQKTGYGSYAPVHSVHSGHTSSPTVNGVTSVNGSVEG